MNKQITRKVLTFLMSLSIIMDIFSYACRWGTVIYLISLTTKNDIPYLKCFCAMAFVRAVLSGLAFFLNRDKVHAEMEKTVDNISNKTEK